MRASTLPADVAAEQAEHERLHPGRICQHCPIERWEQVEMQRRYVAWERRERIRERVQVGFALSVLIGCWLLAGMIH